MDGKQNLPTVLIRGGGDLASGVALTLVRARFQTLITELPFPLMVRRTVSFGQAVYDGTCQVEEVSGALASSPAQAKSIMQNGKVAVIIDPQAQTARHFSLVGLVDARMAKSFSDQSLDQAPCVIGLGPGFTVGVNCHAVIETKRGANLGQVYWQGSAEQDSGIPEPVDGYAIERVLYAPVDGILHAHARIGDLLEAGAQIASVNGQPILAKFKGVLRGLIQNGLAVKAGMKIGDLDPRCQVAQCFLVSDKALRIGESVLQVLQAACNQKENGQTASKYPRC